MRRIAYDTTLDRPGCVMVAATLGADTRVPAEFPTESWILYPSPGMGVYEVSDEQVAILARRVRARYEETGSVPLDSGTTV